MIEQELKDYARSEVKNWKRLNYLPYDASTDNLVSFWLSAVKYGIGLLNRDKADERSVATEDDSSTTAGKQKDKELPEVRVSKAWTYLANNGIGASDMKNGSCFKAYNVLRALQIAAGIKTYNPQKDLEVSDHIEQNGHLFIKEDFVIQKLFPEFLAKILKDGRVKINKGHEHYFSTICGKPTDILKPFIPELNGEGKEEPEQKAGLVASGLKTIFDQWCKETKRSGGVLVGKSIKEFFEWLEEPPTLPEGEAVEKLAFIESRLGIAEFEKLTNDFELFKQKL